MRRPLRRTHTALKCLTVTMRNVSDFVPAPASPPSLPASHSPLPCRYGVLILVVEFIGLTSVLPYGLMLPFFTSSSGSRGLPIDDGRVVLPADKRFRVHILVPCYKVSRLSFKLPARLYSTRRPVSTCTAANL